MHIEKLICVRNAFGALCFICIAGLYICYVSICLCVGCGKGTGLIKIFRHFPTHTRHANGGDSERERAICCALIDLFSEQIDH